MNGSQSLKLEEGSLLWGRFEHREASFLPPEVSEFLYLNVLCLLPLNDFPVPKKHHTMFERCGNTKPKHYLSGLLNHKQRCTYI